MRPVRVGDMVGCYGELVRIGRRSITLQLEVWGKPVLHTGAQHDQRFRVTEAEFVFVAIDEEGRKRPAGLEKSGAKAA